MIKILEKDTVLKVLETTFDYLEFSLTTLPEALINKI